MCNNKYINYIGTPFKELDCYNLVKKIYKDVHNLSILETNTLHNESAKINQEYRNEALNWIKVDKPFLGCIVAIKLDSNLPNIVTHFGYAIDEFKMIHTTEKTNCVVENISKYSKLIDGYFIHKELI